MVVYCCHCVDKDAAMDLLLPVLGITQGTVSPISRIIITGVKPSKYKLLQLRSIKTHCHLHSAMTTDQPTQHGSSQTVIHCGICVKTVLDSRVVNSGSAALPLL